MCVCVFASNWQSADIAWIFPIFKHQEKTREGTVGHILAIPSHAISYHPVPSISSRVFVLTYVHHPRGDIQQTSKARIHLTSYTTHISTVNCTMVVQCRHDSNKTLASTHSHLRLGLGVTRGPLFFFLFFPSLMRCVDLSFCVCRNRTCEFYLTLMETKRPNERFGSSRSGVFGNNDSSITVRVCVVLRDVWSRMSFQSPLVLRVRF